MHLPLLKTHEMLQVSKYCALFMPHHEHLGVAGLDM